MKLKKYAITNVTLRRIRRYKIRHFTAGQYENSKFFAIISSIFYEKYKEKRSLAWRVDAELMTSELCNKKSITYGHA